MIPNLTQRNVDDYKENILRSGINGLEGIITFQLDQLESILKQEFFRLNDRLDGVIYKNPNFKKECSKNYRDSIEVLMVINKFRTLNDSTQDGTEPAQTSSSKKPKSEDISKSTLMSIFRKPSEYDGIMEILVKKGYCQPKTFFWKFEKSGNKKLLASTIKFLHKQGYYKENKMPSGKEIKAIAKNTFGCDMSVETIKGVNSDYCKSKLPLPRSDK